MNDLKTVAWMVRYCSRSFAHNLRFLPEDRAGWKPDPAAKSPLEIAAEAIRVLHMYRPIFDGPTFPPDRPACPVPGTLTEAGTLLTAAGEDYAAALEAAGPELDRSQEMPFGAVFRANRAVCFPLMDLLHHHGQICYLQSLLGDPEMHWDEAAIQAEFIWTP